MEKPLVSIIIPTYNRAHLIGETLDSIIAQTYSNWECLVVDDGSTDNTDEVMAGYVEKDPRFKFHKRPNTKPKGANACRNIGLDKAVGEYVIFFDSDDLMLPEHVKVKTEAILKHNVDYVIAKTKNSNGKPYPNHYYAFDKVALTPYNYILQNINWLTYDIIIKKKLIEDIRFNEKLQSGQEYNFFSKLVLKSTNYYFENQYLTVRGFTDDSIRKGLDNKLKYAKSRFLAEMETLRDIDTIAADNIKSAILISNIKSIYNCPIILSNYRSFINSELKKMIGMKFIYFDIMLIFLKINKGYKIRNLLIRALESIK